MKLFTFLVTLFLFTFYQPSIAQQSFLDPSYGNNGVASLQYSSHQNAQIYCGIMLPDGKILLGGYRDKQNAVQTPDLVLVQFTPEGMPDSSFGSNGKLIMDVFNKSDDYGVKDMAVLPDGKIVLAVSAVGDTSFTQLIRILPSGAYDMSFGINGKIFSYDHDALSIASLCIQPDGKLVLIGKKGSPYYDVTIVRYTADGALDSLFGINGIVKTDLYGTEDLAESGVLQDDGKIVVAGSTTKPDGSYKMFILRYHSDGTLDNSFGTNGKIIDSYIGNDDYASEVLIQPDGKLLIGGGTEGNSFGVSDIGVARYLSDGTPDNSFGNNGKVTAHFGTGLWQSPDILLRPDGKILVVGDYWYQSKGDFMLTQFNADGSQDLSFGINGTIRTDINMTNDNPNKIYLLPDGKIIVAGDAGSSATGQVAIAVRYLPQVTGTKDIDVSDVCCSLSVFPNPVAPKQNTTVQFFLNEQEKVKIELTYSNGKPVQILSESQVLAAGEHQLVCTLPQDLPAGIYFITVSSKDWIRSAKIIR